MGCSTIEVNEAKPKSNNIKNPNYDVNISVDDNNNENNISMKTSNNNIKVV